MLGKFALAEAAVFALSLVTGGLIGWLKKNSRVSAVAGCFCAVVLSFGIWLAFTDFRLGMLISACFSLGLFSFFFERYLLSGQKFVPGGVASIFSAMTFFVSLVALVFG